jgi:hypothetical protein
MDALEADYRRVRTEYVYLLSQAYHNMPADPDGHVSVDICHHRYAKYCDGGSFTGDVSEPVTVRRVWPLIGSFNLSPSPPTLWLSRPTFVPVTRSNHSTLGSGQHSHHHRTSNVPHAVAHSPNRMTHRPFTESAHADTHL